MILLDYVQQMLFDLDHSASQIALQGVFRSLYFHSVDIKIESLILPSMPIFHLLANFTAFCGDFSANAFYEGMLIRQKFWRHLFLPEKLLHLDGAHVQFAIILFLLEPINERVVKEIDIFIVFHQVVLVTAK